MKMQCRWLALISGVLMSMDTWAVDPKDWGNSPYAYDAQQTPIETVLKDFASAYGMGLETNNIQGTVDIKLRSASARDFLDRLAREYKFQWFVFNDILYISPRHEQTTRRLKISGDAVPDLKEALIQIGLLDNRFGWGELADEQAVLVSGPTRYIELIKKFSEQRSPTKKVEPQIMMFSLRHTSVSDRTIRYRDQSMTIDGVATLLKKLLNDDSRQINSALPSPAQAVFQGMQELSDSAQSRLINLATNDGKSPNSALPQPAQKHRVVADIRNNAVLIYDNLDKRDFYQKLINQIDVPAKQIEIDAVIVDIDRHQLEQLGSNWSIQAGGASFGTSLLGASASTIQLQDVGRFFARIQALEGQGLASIIARPSVLTLENQPAVIDFSRTQYITATGERVSNIQPVTAGTSLQVIPRLVGSGQINQFHLVVDIEDGQLEEVESKEAPGVKRGTVSTQAIISEHRSLVIGGFQGEERNNQRRQVPVLGKIPLLGALFSSNDQETLRRERLFILTPRLKGGQPAVIVQHTNSKAAKPLQIRKIIRPSATP